MNEVWSNERVAKMHRTGYRLHAADQALQQGRFARTIMTENSNTRASKYRKRHVAHGDERSVGCHQIFGRIIGLRCRQNLRSEVKFSEPFICKQTADAADGNDFAVGHESCSVT